MITLIVYRTKWNSCPIIMRRGDDEREMQELAAEMADNGSELADLICSPLPRQIGFHKIEAHYKFDEERPDMSGLKVIRMRKMEKTDIEQEIIP